MYLVFLRIPLEKLMERFHVSNFVVKVKLSNSEHQCQVTCCSCCCGCLLCFLAGRGGGVSFKGKGSTDGARTSGQGADGGWVIGWGERVEGNINPEQTDDLCFIGERKSIYVSIWNERIRQRNEIDNLIILFSCVLIKKSQMTGSIFQLSLLLKSHSASNLDQLEGILIYYYLPLPRCF